MSKIDAAIKKLEKSGDDPSLLKALQMAKTLKKMGGERSAAHDAGWWQDGDKKWYKQEAAKTAGPWYFFPTKKLKNGGLSGLMVDESFDRRAKKKSISKMDFRLYKEIPATEVPTKTRSMIEHAT